MKHLVAIGTIGILISMFVLAIGIGELIEQEKICTEAWTKNVLMQLENCMIKGN